MINKIREKLFHFKVFLKVSLLEYWIKIISKILNKNGLQDNLIQKYFRKYNWNLIRLSDYSSPLPDIIELRKNEKRWNKPSKLNGISFDINQMKQKVSYYVDTYYSEYQSLGSWDKMKDVGYGPGIPEVDCFILYSIIRDIKPKIYIEIGSGLSTYYVSLAREKNQEEGHELEIICVEPYPYKKLYEIDSIEIIKNELQNIDISLFDKLGKDDMLFIDSTHVLKIDGDVPYLYLEILPVLHDNVNIHIHDIPFPYNIPFPANEWILNKKWPVFWNEAMIVQAFLLFNKEYIINLSLPIIRFYEETFLLEKLPIYKPIEELPNTFSSLWLKKKKTTN